MKVAFYTATRPGWQGLYSRLVRWIDKGRFSHCEVIFSDGMCASASYLDGGVRFKRIEFDESHWEIIEVDADESRARDWFISHEGDAYDLIGTARFLFGLIPQNPNRWFCSESVAAALGKADAWRFGPCGLYADLAGKD